MLTLIHTYTPTVCRPVGARCCAVAAEHFGGVCTASGVSRRGGRDRCTPTDRYLID